MRYTLFGITLSFLLLVACSTNQKEVILPVTLVTDEEFASQYGEEVGRQLIESVSSFYRKEFGIRLEIQEIVMDWNSPELESIPEGTLDLAGMLWLMDDAATVIPSHGRIVVALTAANLAGRYPGISLVTERRGFTEYYALVWYDSENPKNGLIHELAHLFGAKHPIEEWGWDYTEKHSSVMNAHQVFETDEFDPKNRTILESRTALPALP